MSATNTVKTDERKKTKLYANSFKNKAKTETK